MAHSRVKWEGLDELRELLRALPEELREEGEGIVLDAASGAKDDIYAAYPVWTGNLRNGLQMRSLDGSDDFFFRTGSKLLGAGAILFNNAKHAYIFEHGTAARHSGIRSTGIMPAGNVFIPRVIKWRNRMYDALARMLEGHGFEVRRAA